MLPIIIKDIRENLKTWILFALLAAAGMLLSVVLEPSPERQSKIQGLIIGVVLASSLFFTLNVVINERKRRHFVFLKSLPLDDRDVIQAKFLAVALLTGTLGNIPFLMLFLLGSPPTFAHWLLANGGLLFYSSLLLFCSIRFQNSAILFGPLYLMIGPFLLPESVLVEIQALLLAVLGRPFLFLALASCTALLFL
ncbi:MAG: ABC-2 transporter permease, partial [Acidobacteriota bacterium]